MGTLRKIGRVLSVVFAAFLAAVRAGRASQQAKGHVGADLRVRPRNNRRVAAGTRADTQVRPYHAETHALGAVDPDEFHLPAPSIWPAAVAFGVTLAFFGVVTSNGFFVVGAALTVVAIAGWIGELRHV